jgi:hypothetical protein
MVSERVRRHRGVAAIETTGATRTTGTAGAARTAIPTTAAIAAEATTTSAEAAAAKATAKGPATASKAATAVTSSAHSWAGKAILTDLEHAALPIVAVELLDGGASIVRRLEDNNAGALGSAVRAKVDIGANNTACTG